MGTLSLDMGRILLLVLLSVFLQPIVTTTTDKDYLIETEDDENYLVQYTISEGEDAENETVTEKNECTEAGLVNGQTKVHQTWKCLGNGTAICTENKQDCSACDGKLKKTNFEKTYKINKEAKREGCVTASLIKKCQPGVVLTGVTRESIKHSCDKTGQEKKREKLHVKTHKTDADVLDEGTAVVEDEKDADVLDEGTAVVEDEKDADVLDGGTAVVEDEAPKPY